MEFELALWTKLTDLAVFAAALTSDVVVNAFITPLIAFALDTI